MTQHATKFVSTWTTRHGFPGGLSSALPSFPPTPTTWLPLAALSLLETSTLLCLGPQAQLARICGTEATLQHCP